MYKSNNIVLAGVLRLRKTIWMLLALTVLFPASPLLGQEALQNEAYGRSAATSRAKQLQNEDYTFKYGDFRLLALPYAGIDWNDNVNLSQTNKQDDFIVHSGVRFTSSYPITEQNVLFLDISVGYDRYLYNPSYSTFDLNSSSGTGLSFDIGIKDVNINLHDWVSYVQDSSQNSSVANTATYGVFQNTAGVAATWDLNKASLSAGYDNQYIRSTSAEFDEINRMSQLFFLRPGLVFNPQCTAGLEATASLTTYEQDTLNNNNAYTIGLFTDYVPSKAIKVSARSGFSTYQFQSSSKTVVTSDQNGWYADATLTHKVTERVTYSINAGHSVQLGTQSDLNEITYVRPDISWNIINGWPISTGLFYEHGNQGIGNVIGNTTEIYDWYGGTLSLQHAITKKFFGSIYYRLTLRNSDTPNNGYTQNLVGFVITYRP